MSTSILQALGDVFFLGGSCYQAGLEIATNTVTNATNTSSLATKASGLDDAVLRVDE